MKRLILIVCVGLSAWVLAVARVGAAYEVPPAFEATPIFDTRAAASSLDSEITWWMEWPNAKRGMRCRR